MQFNSPARLLITILFLATIFSGCKKETSDSLSLTPTEEEDAARTMSYSEAEAELVFNDVFDNAMGVNNDVGIAGTGIFGRSVTMGLGQSWRTDSNCFTLKITHLGQTFFPVKVEIDFGNGCVGRDGHVRRGKVSTVYTNRLIHSGAIATTTFENFYFDSIRVEGIHRVTNMITSALTRQYKIEVENGKLSKPNGNYSEWNSQKMITQTDGVLTADLPLDDIYRIEGHSNGKVKNGNLLFAWNSEITQPLMKKFTCRWIIEGRVRTNRITSPTNSPWVAVLDYGQGTCDRFATITINGNSYQISLN